MVIKSKAGLKGTIRLRRYWTRGTGGKVKVRWGVPGDFNRCVGHLRKYVRDPKGYCALRHHDALGIWPAQHGRRRRR